MKRVLTSAVLGRAPLFLTSWTAANAQSQSTSATDFTLKDGTTRAVFQSAVTNLETLAQNVDDAQSRETVLMATRDGLRAQTQATMKMWRAAAEYAVGEAPVGAHLPVMLAETDALDKAIHRFKEVSERWEQIDAATGIAHFTAPLVLKDGTTRAAFDAQITALQNAGDELEKLDLSLPVSRAARDNAAQSVYETFRLYREGVIATFPDDSPVVQTLPTLQAPDTGHTPEPVTLTGAYNPQTGAGDLQFTASTDPDFAHYAVRISAGPRYKGDDATNIAQLQSGVTTYAIPAHYLPAGSTLWAVVAVVLTDGREKASNSVKFAVPLG